MTKGHKKKMGLGKKLGIGLGIFFGILFILGIIGSVSNPSQQPTQQDYVTSPAVAEELDVKQDVKITKSISPDLIIDANSSEFIITRGELLGDGWFKTNSWGDYVYEVEWTEGTASTNRPGEKKEFHSTLSHIFLHTNGEIINIGIRKYQTPEGAKVALDYEFHRLKEVRGSVKLEAPNIGDETLAATVSGSYELAFIRNNYYVSVAEFFSYSKADVEYYARLIDKKIVESV